MHRIHAEPVYRDDENGRYVLYEDVEKLINLLKESNIALDDAIVIYAPEFCGDDTVNETRKRIKNNGGTLAYFATLREKINKII